MKTRRVLTLLLVLIALFALVAPAMAGGWATYTLEELPQTILAGEPLTIRYTIRQHGVKPLTVDASYVVAKHLETGKTLSTRAESGTKPGEYIATLTFPVAGSWEWSVDGFGKQTWPDLTVLPSTAVSSPVEPASTSMPSSNPAFLTLFGWLLAAGALAYAFLKRKRWALGLALVGVLVGVAGLNAGNIRTSAQSQVKQVGALTLSPEQYGQALFVAKGCITCHDNRNIDRKYRGNSVGLAVDLTSYPTSLEYLRIWLKDPASVKPKTEMPNLALDEAEIEALASFLLASAGK